MCGILAYYSPQDPFERSPFVRALRSLAKRGPDAETIWSNQIGTVALGHRLLHLTGKKATSQPLSNEDESIHAVVNGEFYQYEQHRSALESSGHRFRTDSDSELLVHLYEEFGTSCLSKLNGEFAFVLWDEKRQKLFGARDRFGIKPLHYASSNSKLLLSSEAKALLAYGLPARWSTTALAQAFTHQYLAPGESLFEGIRQVPPAHYFFHTAGEEFTLHRYWQPQRTQEKKSPQELLEKLATAVKARIHPKAAYSLSGGIDSSLVVKLASQHLGEEVPTFTVQFDHANYNETPLVQTTAAQLGAKQHPVFISQSALIDTFSEAVTASEGLAINGQLVGKYCLNQAIHQAGYRTVLSGEGSDEALLGYAHLLTDFAGDNSPTPTRQRGVMLPPTSFAMSSSPPAWLDSWPTFLKAKSAFCQQLQPLLAPDFRAELEKSSHLDRTMAQLHAQGYVTDSDDHPHKCASLWTSLALSSSILKTLGDGCEMTHSVEGRVPFLDVDFFEFAWSLPLEQKLQGITAKAILRKAAEDILPATIATREKHPFLAPPLLSNAEQFRKVQAILQSSLLSNVTFLDSKTIHAWLNKLQDSSEEDRKSADPLVHLILSCLFLQNSYQLNL